MVFAIVTSFSGKISTHHTVVFWGSEIWLEIFAQNPGFTIVKLEKKINSEGKLW